MLCLQELTGKTGHAFDHVLSRRIKRVPVSKANMWSHFGGGACLTRGIDKSKACRLKHLPGAIC